MGHDEISAASARELAAAIAKQRKQAAAAVRDFVQGAASGDTARMVENFGALNYGQHDGGGWTRAMREVSRLASVPLATQEFFLRAYVKWGDSMRQECADDLALADGLRILLPRYRGAGKRLYRGEGFHNRSRRTYGLSWTTSVEVARAHAETGLYRTGNRGSVLLETLAPVEAIICAVPVSYDRYDEKEYLVDRRRLTSVKVIERFSPAPLKGQRTLPPNREDAP